MWGKLKLLMGGISFGCALALMLYTGYKGWINDWGFSEVLIGYGAGGGWGFIGSQWLDES